MAPRLENVESFVDQEASQPPRRFPVSFEGRGRRRDTAEHNRGIGSQALVSSSKYGNVLFSGKGAELGRRARMAQEPCSPAVENLERNPPRFEPGPEWPRGDPVEFLQNLDDARRWSIHARQAEKKRKDMGEED